jgi:hypothetical protein
MSFRQLRVCYFVVPSLTRGRVCNLLYNCLWSLPEQSLLGSKSRRTHGHVLLYHLRLPQPGGPGPRIYIPQEQGGPVILVTSILICAHTRARGSVFAGTVCRTKSDMCAIMLDMLVFSPSILCGLLLWELPLMWSRRRKNSWWQIQ